LLEGNSFEFLLVFKSGNRRKKFFAKETKSAANATPVRNRAQYLACAAQDPLATLQPGRISGKWRSVNASLG
jgi:hypothetical protein